jgi:hypothetical protein
MPESTNKYDCNGREIFVGDLVVWGAGFRTGNLRDGWFHIFHIYRVHRDKDGRWILGYIYNRWEGPELTVIDENDPRIKDRRWITENSPALFAVDLFEAEDGSWVEATTRNMNTPDEAERIEKDQDAVRRRIERDLIWGIYPHA